MNRIFNSAAYVTRQFTPSSFSPSILLRKYTRGNAMSYVRPKKTNRIIRYGSMLLWFKIAYDIGTGYFSTWSGKVHTKDIHIQLWNEAVADIFSRASKDEDVKEQIGSPVKLGPPPPLSKSPLTINRSGVEFDVVIGPYSIFRASKAGDSNKLSSSVYDNEDRVTVVKKEKEIKRPPSIPVHLMPGNEDDAKLSSLLPSLRLPSISGYAEVKVPLEGKLGKAELIIIAYTQGGEEWAVKHAFVVKQNGKVVKQIVEDHVVPGISCHISL
eukprot:TRINITY_DN3769_c0_g1_i1.p1 TRINITY_DN3769_c0_g1~~TRINITY_DN3769_c0_g1_i1.p1  ORF type:complete len:269 (-),score=75.51 TRINITY_DN3769_c0_g1_i1:85-891(-)